MSDVRPAPPSPDSRSLRETTFLAATSLLGFALGLVRTKLLAVAWGPAAVGAMGMMQASMGAATLVSGLGIDGVVPSELGKQPERGQQATIVAAALHGSAVIAFLGAVASFFGFWLLTPQLGLGGPAALALLAVGVFATVWSMNLRALLAGVGALGAVGAVGVVGAVVAAGGAVLLSWGPSQPETWALAVAIVPGGQLLVACFLAFRTVPRPELPWAKAVRGALSLARQSNLLAITGILVVVGQVLIRWVAQEQVSAGDFGSFQAAMTLAAASVSVLAGSVGPSVLPRISAVSHDPIKMAEILEEQIFAYLLLFLPVALCLIAVPELVVRLLYSDGFLPAGSQLRWLMVGEILRLPTWVTRTVLIVKARYRAYFLLEASSLAISLMGVVLAGRFDSLALIGVALSVASGVYFVMLSFMVSQDGVTMTARAKVRLVAILSGAVLAALAAHFSRWGQAAVAVGCALAGVSALRRLLKLRLSH